MNSGPSCQENMCGCFCICLQLTVPLRAEFYTCVNINWHRCSGEQVCNTCVFREDDMTPGISAPWIQISTLINHLLFLAKPGSLQGGTGIHTSYFVNFPPAVHLIIAVSKLTLWMRIMHAIGWGRGHTSTFIQFTYVFPHAISFTLNTYCSHVHDPVLMWFSRTFPPVLISKHVHLHWSSLLPPHYHTIMFSILARQVLKFAVTKPMHASVLF